MSKFRNQASIRTRASRIGGGAIILSIILISMFTSQVDEEPALNTEMITTAPSNNLSSNTLSSLSRSEMQVDNEESESRSLESKSLESKSLEELEKFNKNELNKDVLGKKTTTRAKMAAPMQTSSMVQYGSMETMLEGNGGKIVWKTLAQRHIKHFEIERSIDDKTYVSIGILEGEGTGEHLQEKLYEFLDSKLGLVQMPRVYYRIKQVGFDGMEDYSEVIEHDFNLDLGLYARIEEKSSGKLNILYAADKSGPITLRVLNVAGQVIEDRNLEADFDPQLLAIDASDWKDGKYFLQLQDESSSVMEQFEYQD